MAFLEIESYLFVLMKLLVSVIGGLLYFYYDRISFVKQTRYIILFTILVYLSIIIQALFYPGTDNTNVYIVGYSMVVYSTYFLIGIRLKDSFVINMIAQIIFYTLLINRYPSQMSVGIYIYILQANVVFFISAYFVEKTGRKLFIYISKLEAETESQIKSYKILEQKYENLKKESLRNNNVVEEQIIRKQNVNKKNDLLIVDDEKDNVLYFEQVALKLRLNLFKAKNGLDAVNMYKKYKSDIALVLMDIRMPEMNGYEATKEIKKINKDVPVILITAYSESVRKESEADLILSKPITPKALTDAIKQYI